MNNPKRTEPSVTASTNQNSSPAGSVTEDGRQRLERLECELAAECWKFYRRQRTTEPAHEEFPDMPWGTFDSICRLTHIQFEQQVKNRLVRSNKSPLPEKTMTETLLPLEDVSTAKETPRPAGGFMRVPPAFAPLGIPGPGHDPGGNPALSHPAPTAPNPKNT